MFILYSYKKCVIMSPKTLKLPSLHWIKVFLFLILFVYKVCIIRNLYLNNYIIKQKLYSSAGEFQVIASKKKE